jgi:5'-3' exonuclease
MRTLHLIDGTFELFRTYHALPKMAAPGGEEVGAVRGLVASTLALLRDLAVTHVAAATDHVIESFRNDLFDGYKTGEGIPPDLWAQFPLAEEAYAALGITVWAMVEFEADDALATAAAYFAEQVDRVMILSPDKDLMQCVTGDRVVTLDRLRGRLYDEAAVHAKFGIGPGLVPDYLALVGDTADGIPGIPGWGAKSAAAVLAAFGALEAIPDDWRTWPGSLRNRERLAEALAENRAAASLYKRLATLRRDVPLSARPPDSPAATGGPCAPRTDAVRLDDLRWTGVPRRRYQAFCERLGFSDLAVRPTVWAP